ncbi:MAG: zinc carboxypeptidase [Caulobacteraceae bacterium]|nr:MAG: zinc carboxypeptidase [Caulobacteraceae bacterium]
MVRCLVALALTLAVALPVAAQDRPRAVWTAGAAYDTAIPEPKAVVGHELGERLTLSADVRRYFEVLAAAAPDRMRIGDYGRSWEGRVLPYGVISSARNMARLDEIQANARALADPRRTDVARARAIMAEQPAIVWLAYSVHGNETSPAEAAMATARHLLASRDPAVAGWLDRTVVILVPTQNPDGRDRFINGYEAAFGLEPDTDPASAERAEPWPAGRFNHYLFDLNRDWFAQTQPETRGHSALMRQWYPQVVADAHEMGSNTTFFFPPEADPLNPLLPEAQVRSRALFGRNHAAVFDREGVDYFTRESYDAFYPGYGDNWPSYFGAISMTYEQAGVRGLAVRQTTGEVLTLADAVRNHFLISLSTIQTAADNRERLLKDFYDYQVSSMAQARAAGSWILPRTAADPGAADRLAQLLARQGIEVSRVESGAKACGKTYEAGAYVIDGGQPHGRLVQVLFDRSVSMTPQFIAEQERRRAKGLAPEMYDVTGWALPPLFNTPAERCKGAPSGRPLAVDEIGKGYVAGAERPVAYIVPPGSQAMALLAGALRQDLRLRSPEKGFTVGGRTYAAGALVIPAAGNPADLRQRLDALTARTGAVAIGVEDSWVTQGPSFGSEFSPAFVAPRIAMAWDQPTSPPAAGATRYLIERGFDYPVSVIRTDRLGAADLARYQVLILPDGAGYRSRLGAGGVAAIKDWVRRGGVLIALGGAVELLADPDVDLIAARLETMATPEGEKAAEGVDAKKATTPGALIKDASAYDAALRPVDAGPASSPGVVAKALVDRDHWLGAGVAPNVNVLAAGGAIYTPLRLDQGVNVARFAAADEVLVAGYLWKETRQQLAFKPLVMVQELGRGQVIAFTQDPTARGFQRGMDVLFLNAIFRGAAHASPTR